MKNKFIVFLLLIILNINIFSNVAIASTVDKVENIKTYYVTNEDEKITILNYIISNMETMVNIVYSGDTVPSDIDTISKNNIKFHYTKNTFNSFYKYQDVVYKYLYNVGVYNGFGIKEIEYEDLNNTVSVLYRFSYFDKINQAKDVNDIVNKAIKENVENLKSDYEKVLWAYQWVIDNVHYDKTLSNFSAYSSFTDNGTVCVGYATLYNAIINKLGLDCKLVNGSVYNSKGNNHAWNIVKLEGKWYCVDVTWGDSGDINKYFLKSKDTFLRDDYGVHTSKLYDEYIEVGEIFADTDYVINKENINEFTPTSPSVYDINLGIVKSKILQIGDTYKFIIDNPNNIDLQVDNTSPSIATIDDFGNIIANDKGETVITVFNRDLNIAQSCYITVK